MSTLFLFQRLREAAGALVDHGIVTEEALRQRAIWLEKDLETMAPDGFEILPSSWIEPPDSNLRFPLVEYQFHTSDHNINRADNPAEVQKNVNTMSGTGLDREHLLYLSKVCEIGHTIIPHLWPTDRKLRSSVRLGTKHLDTLNEVWWLSRWHGVDAGSVILESLIRIDDDNLSKSIPKTVDWEFTVLDKQISIRIEVKNRRGTKGSEPFNKGVYLFDAHPEEPFAPSGKDQINVLAITAYHAGWISEKEEHQLITAYIDQLKLPLIDAVALAVKGARGSYEKLYFPTNRDLQKKDQILKAIFKPMDIEDHSFVGSLTFPMTLDDAIRNALSQTNNSVEASY